MNLTKKEQAYLNEIAAQLLTTHGENAAAVIVADPIGAVGAAHAKRVEFAEEILAQSTDRSQMAKIVLGAGVFAECNLRKAFEHCGHIADRTYRRSIGLG